MESSTQSSEDGFRSFLIILAKAIILLSVCFHFPLCSWSSLSDHPPLASEMIFIDASVQDLEVLADTISPGVDVQLLNATQDGLEQITDILYTYRDMPEQ